MGYIKERYAVIRRNQGLMSDYRSDSPDLKEAFQEANLYEKTVLILSSWFGTGLMPLAPGSFGTLAAVPPVIIINYFGSFLSGISLIVLIPLAVWTSNISQKLLGKDDPPEVVIDEVTGFRTESVLCAPFYAQTGEVVGALQLLNKKTGKFTREDENKAQTSATILSAMNVTADLDADRAKETVRD